MAAKKYYAFLDSRHLPTVVFTAVTLVGCLFIFVAKTVGVWTIVAIAVPIILMFGYLSLSYFVGKLRIHDEQTGDNLYYMGFLFTLTSLAVSLYQFGTGGKADDIVQNFGVAVSSTITGIALRIFYNQVRRDPVGTEGKVREELADTTRRITAEMDASAREFADFRRVCNQMLEEGFDEIARQAEQNGTSIRRAYEGMVSEALKPLQETSVKTAENLESTFSRIEDRFSGIAEKVDNVADNLDQANTSMADTVSNFEKQAKTVAGKLESITIPDAVLKSELMPLMTTLVTSIGKFTERSEALSREQRDRTEKILGAVEQLAQMQNEFASQMMAQTDRSSDSLTKMLEALLERDLNEDAASHQTANTLSNITTVTDAGPTEATPPPVAINLGSDDAQDSVSVRAAAGVESGSNTRSPAQSVPEVKTPESGYDGIIQRWWR